MHKLKCIIVEDESLAAEILADYIKEVPFLNLEHIYEDAVYALQGMTDDIDVIFLDIHLPKIKGLDFIKTLKNPPQIILTTAFHEYAIDAFDLNVVDYLLKPISFQRFLRATQKLKRNAHSNSEPKKQNQTFHYFRVDRTNVKISLQEITVVESLKDYIRIHTMESTYITKYQLKRFIETFPDAQLVRIHKSFAVSKRHIHSFSANEVNMPTMKLKIGRTYKASTEEQLKDLIPGQQD